jgi:hypothetical protein
MLQISERAGRASIRFFAPSMGPLLDRALAELVAGGLLRMLLVYGGGRADIHAVRFTHARPDYHHAYTAAFQGAERFSQLFNELEIESHALDRPNLHSLPELHAAVRAQAERYLDRLVRPATFVERLEAVLLTQPPASTSVEQVARISV